jgi:hypothetical protein
MFFSRMKQSMEMAARVDRAHCQFISNVLSESCVALSQPIYCIDLSDLANRTIASFLQGFKDTDLQDPRFLDKHKHRVALLSS